MNLLDNSTKYKYPTYGHANYTTRLPSLDYRMNVKLTSFNRAYIRINEFDLNDINDALINLGADKKFCDRFIFEMDEEARRLKPQFDSYEEELEYYRCG